MMRGNHLWPRCDEPMFERTCVFLGNGWPPLPGGVLGPPKNVRAGRLAAWS